MAEKLRAGVIGCGLGSAHAYAYDRSEEFDLVAVCDLKPEVLDALWDRAKLERGSVPQYPSHREMLEAHDLDVVSVATPDHLHVDPICDASNAGVRGVLCEKPISTTLKDADRIIDVTEANGTVMSVDHTRSWIPSFQAVKREIEAGKIGGLTRIIAHLGGHRAMLFRNGTHTVDAVCYFAGAPPVWVMAAHEPALADYGVVYSGEGGKNPDLDPASTVIIEFANGVRGILNGAKMTPALHEIDLQGPEGRYVLDDEKVAAWRTEKVEGAPIETDPPPARGYADYFGDNLVPAVDELARMVLDGAPSSSPARRGRDTLEILIGALISQTRDGARVAIPLPRD
jgi:predicted dehydrogenase